MLIFLIIKWFTFELLQRMSISETESSKNPLKGDAEKNYEAVEMLKTEIDEDGVDKEKGSNKSSEDQITLRRVFLKKCENAVQKPLLSFR